MGLPSNFQGKAGALNTPAQVDALVDGLFYKKILSKDNGSNSMNIAINCNNPNRQAKKKKKKIEYKLPFQEHQNASRQCNTNAEQTSQLDGGL